MPLSARRVGGSAAHLPVRRAHAEQAQLATAKTGKTLLGGSRVSQPEPGRWEVDGGSNQSGTWGVYRLRLCACEYTHKTNIWQDEHTDVDHLFGKIGRLSCRRWTCASSLPWSPSPTTARSRPPPAPCSRCSRTSPATSPVSRRSSARRLVDRASAGSPTTAPGSSSGRGWTCGARRHHRRDGPALTATSLATSASACSGTTARWLLPACSPRCRPAIPRGASSSPRAARRR